MTDELVLGLDLGTGSTKVGLVDADGRLVAVARRPHPPIAPQPGWSETDPARWSDAMVAAVQEVLDGVEPTRVVGIGLSGQMHGVVVCGHSGTAGVPEPLRPAILWSDRRSQPDLEQLRSVIPPDTMARLANPVVAGMAGPTMVALRRLEPEVFDRVRYVLQPKDWIRTTLTGTDDGDGGCFTDPSDASGTLLWDVADNGWSAAAQEIFGLDPAWLPTVHPSSAPVGALSAPAAARLGLPPGLVVATGAADTAAALYGAGLGPGQAQLSTGSGGQLAIVLDEPAVDPRQRTHLYRAVDIDGSPTWYAMAAIQNCGLAIDWALRLLGLEPGSAATAATLADAMTATEPGCDGVTFLPYLTGERTPHLNGDLCGAWVGLRPNIDRAAVLRSVFEGVAFALRDGLDALRQAGKGIDDAFLAGGGSVAPWWRQLLADTLEITLTPRNEADASVLGAGLLAWSATGHRPDGGFLDGPHGRSHGGLSGRSHGGLSGRSHGGLSGRSHGGLSGRSVGLIDAEPITPVPATAALLQVAAQRYRDRLAAATPG